MGNSNSTTGGAPSKEGGTSYILGSTARFFREHPAMLGSLLYLLVTCMGMVYSFVLYKSFGINIFDFAEINDLLLAAFKDLAAFIMSMFTIALCISFPMLWSTIFARRRRRMSSVGNNSPLFMTDRMNSAMTLVMVPVTLIYAFVPPYLFASSEARSIRNNSERPVIVSYRLTTSTSAQPAVESNVELIGATEKVAFFYDPGDERTLVIPHAQIISIEFPK